MFAFSPDPALLSAGHHCIVLEAGRVAAQVRHSTAFYSVLRSYVQGSPAAVRATRPDLTAARPAPRSAGARWRLLRTVAKTGLAFGRTGGGAAGKAARHAPVCPRPSVQDCWPAQMRASSRRLRASQRASQLSLQHDLLLPSDEGHEESLGDMEGLLSSRHKQLLLKAVIKH